MVCRLIDERYPDYENVIPSDNSNNITVDKSEILNSLKRISIYANKTTNQVRLKVSGSEILISAEDLDFSNEANERISCDHEGSDIEIGFNAKFLIEILSNILSDKVIFKLSEPNRAGLILPEDIDDDEDLTMLVMPVMLNDNA
jgi:DNA polymerase-3 subunit beta